MAENAPNIAGSLTVAINAPLDKLAADLARAEQLAMAYNVKIDAALSKSGGGAVAQSASALVSRLTAPIADVSPPVKKATESVEKFAKSAEHSATALGLNRVQMLELTHVGRELATMFTMGVDPMRAFTMESGRITTFFQMGEGGMGATFIRFLPILGAVAGAFGVVGLALDAFKDKLNAGKTQAVGFFAVLKGVGVTAWDAFKGEFDSAPGWMTDLWRLIGNETGAAVNNLIQQFAILGANVQETFKEIPLDVESAIEGMSNTAINWLNNLTDAVNAAGRALARLSGQTVAEPTAAEIAATHIGPVSFAGNADDEIKRLQAGLAQRVATISGTDYLGQVYKNALPGASDVHAKENPYDRAVQSAKAATAALDAQTAALGKTSYQTAYLEEHTRLLNDATSRGAKLSQEQMKNLDDLAASYAMAKSNLEALTQAYDLGKSATEDFFSTFKSDIENGASLWQSFGDAASKVLDDIANKALQMAADGIWNMIFGSMMGSSGGSNGGIGGFIASLFGGASVPAFASGTNSAPGGLSLVGERGPELVRLPAGAGVYNAAQTAGMFNAAANSAANGNGIHVTVGVSVDNNGNLQAYVQNVSQQSTKAGIAGYDAVLPDRILHHADRNHAAMRTLGIRRAG